MKLGDTNDRTTRTCMKTRGEIRCCGRVSISCFACGIRCDVPYVVSRNETYSLQQYHGLHVSLAMVVTKGVSNDGNDHSLSVDLSLVSMKSCLKSILI